MGAVAFPASRAEYQPGNQVPFGMSLSKPLALDKLRGKDGI